MEIYGSQMAQAICCNAGREVSALSGAQKKYREEFGGIVDQYLILYSSERDEKSNGYHRIVYIDADNDIKWRVEKEDKLTPEDQKSRN